MGAFHGGASIPRTGRKYRETVPGKLWRRRRQEREGAPESLGGVALPWQWELLAQPPPAVCRTQVLWLSGESAVFCMET